MHLVVAMFLNRIVVLAVLFLFCRVSLQNDEEVAIVNTTLGDIQGSIMQNRNGEKIFAFRGIRYAQPPVDELRFKPPVPVEPWEGLLKATSDSLVCPQPGIKLFMSEDCLAINVYSKNLNGYSSVIVYIHGGAYVLGSGHSQYEAGPQYLLDHNVVLVTFNYRLGALGFLSTQTSHAPGNYGFLDQVLALQWVQTHIRSFGGNPRSVTLLGLSAGAMAVTLHMVSPLSKVLFQRAIVMSGSATNHYHIDNLYWTQKLAREASCPIYDPESLVECLRKLDWGTIMDICSRWEWYGFVNMKWNYEIDSYFLTAHPTLLYLNHEYNGVPLLVGITKNELDFSTYHLADNIELLEDINKNFNYYAPEIFLYNSDNPNNRDTSERIRKFYFNENNITVDNLSTLGEIFSDAIIGHGVHRLVQLTHKLSQVYYYRMDYVGAQSLYVDENKNPRGVGHADDWRYVMPSLWYGKADDTDMLMVDRITLLWTSFAQIGIPISLIEDAIWNTSGPNNVSVLYNNNETAMGDAFYQDRYALWDELFPIAMPSSANQVFKIHLFPLVIVFLIIIYLKR